MNVTEANATNLLLRYVLGLPSLNQCGDGATQFNNDAGEAVLLLAERARKALGAGLNLDDVRDAWNRLELAGVRRLRRRLGRMSMRRRVHRNRREPAITQPMASVRPKVTYSPTW